VITAIQYSNIVCAIDQIDAYQLNSLSELAAMQNSLSVTQGDPSRKNSLRIEIEQVRTAIIAERTTPIPQMVEAVRSLNEHVVTFYGSVNGFLSGNGIRVSQFFATISNTSGFPISEANIGESCV